MWFLIGVAYTLLGLFIYARFDVGFQDVAREWVGSSPWRLVILLVFWPGVLPLVWGRIAVAEDADEHGQL